MSTGRAGVFFDRDGTLNEEVDFLSTPEQLQLIPGAAAAVRAVNLSGMAACVVSNQSGIARGLFRETDLGPIHEKLESQLARTGARLDSIYYCPHHPTEGIPPYNVDCDCRKPRTGMLRRAERELGIDLRRSYVVGDRLVDVQAGQAVGGKGILVLTGWGARTRGELAAGNVTPDFIAASVQEAVEFILHEDKGETGTND